MEFRDMASAPKDGRYIELDVRGATGGGIIKARWMGSWWGFDRLTLGVPKGWREVTHEQLRQDARISREAG